MPKSEEVWMDVTPGHLSYVASVCNVDYDLFARNCRWCRVKCTGRRCDNCGGPQ
jgi:hypothetical protein